MVGRDEKLFRHSSLGAAVWLSSLDGGRGEESFRHSLHACFRAKSLLEPGELGPVQDVSEGAFHLDLAAHRNCACFGNEAAARNAPDRVEIRDATNGETLLLAEPYFLRDSANRRRHFDDE